MNLPWPLSSGTSSGMPSLIDRLMRDAADGIYVSDRLPDLKRVILLDGIEADDTGMVSPPSTRRVALHDALRLGSIMASWLPSGCSR